MGIKPLYFNLRGGELYFGSELKTIFAHPEFKRELDFTGLHYYLSMNYVPCPHTLVAGVAQLPPGDTIRYHDGGGHDQRSSRWGSPSPPATDNSCSRQGRRSAQSA